ncbi:MAG: hypothetical protein R3B45_17565 [Bdellovibrionota bacterium]
MTSKKKPIFKLKNIDTEFSRLMKNGGKDLSSNQFQQSNDSNKINKNDPNEAKNNFRLQDGLTDAQPLRPQFSSQNGQQELPLKKGVSEGKKSENPSSSKQFHASDSLNEGESQILGSRLSRKLETGILEYSIIEEGGEKEKSHISFSPTVDLDRLRQGKVADRKAPRRPASDFRSEHGFRQAQSDPYIARRKNFIVFTMTVIVCLLAYVFFTNKPLQKIVLEFAIETVDDIKGKILRDSNKSQIKKTSKRHKGLSDSTIVEEMRQALATDNCGMITQVGLKGVKSRSLSVMSRVRVADCFQVKNNSTDANIVLKSVKTDMLKMSDTTIKNSMIKGTGYGEGYLLSILILISQGRIDDALLFGKNRCLSWKFSPTCVGKILLMAMSGKLNVANSGYKMIAPGSARGAEVSRAYYYYAGGRLASLQGQSSASDERYSKASRLSTKSNAALSKEIYNAWSLDLYLRKDTANLTKLAHKLRQNPTKVSEEDIMWKILLYKSLIDPKQGSKNLKKFFEHQSTGYKVRGDYEFALAIGSDSIRWNLSRPYSAFLSEINGYLRTRQHASSAIMSRLDLWNIRSNIALGQYDRTFRMIENYEKRYGKSYLTRHIKGIAYMNLNGHSSSQLLAAREFRASISKRPNWQGYYGLAISLLHAEELRAAWQAIKKLERMVTTNVGKKWHALALAEYLIADGKAKGALELIHKILASDPNSITAWEIKAVAHRKLIQAHEARRAQQKADSLHQTIGYLNSDEGINSPIGPLALIQ